MAQARYFDYGFTLTSDAYAFLLSQTFVPGVYQGLDISQGVSRDEVVISPGTVLLDDGVAINENQPQTIKFYTGASQQFLVVVRHQLRHIVGGTPADFGVIPFDNLSGWVAGYSYYVIGTISVHTTNTDVLITYSSAQKIKDRLAYIIENFSASSISQSFVAPLVGKRGVQGFQGWQGPQGWQGEQGYQGNQGLTGADGPPGPGGSGPQGNQGLIGADGPGGSGTQGNQGNQGLTGPGIPTVVRQTYGVAASSIAVDVTSVDGWVSLAGTWVVTSTQVGNTVFIDVTVVGRCDTNNAYIQFKLQFDGVDMGSTQGDGLSRVTVPGAVGPFVLNLGQGNPITTRVVGFSGTLGSGGTHNFQVFAMVETPGVTFRVHTATVDGISYHTQEFGTP